MASAQNSHGGQEQTIHALYTTFMHWGAIIAAPGYTDPSIFASGGNPYGTSVTVDQDGNMVEKVEDAVKHQARRTVQVAQWLGNELKKEKAVVASVTAAFFVFGPRPCKPARFYRSPNFVPALVSLT